MSRSERSRTDDELGDNALSLVAEARACGGPTLMEARRLDRTLSPILKGKASVFSQQPGIRLTNESFDSLSVTETDSFSWIGELSRGALCRWCLVAGFLGTAGASFWLGRVSAPRETEHTTMALAAPEAKPFIGAPATTWKPLVTDGPQFHSVPVSEGLTGQRTVLSNEPPVSVLGAPDVVRKRTIATATSRPRKNVASISDTKVQTDLDLLAAARRGLLRGDVSLAVALRIGHFARQNLREHAHSLKAIGLCRSASPRLRKLGRKKAREFRRQYPSSVFVDLVNDADNDARRQKGAKVTIATTLSDS